MFRYSDSRWAPLGEPLPEFAHAPITPQAAIATWVLPAELGSRTGDVIVAHETAHRLLMKLPPSDDAWTTVAQQAATFAEADEVRDWLGQVELWLGQRLAPDTDWPAPTAVAE